MSAARQPPNTGIPTWYRGTLYRSRLEARWAAFFDLVKWEFSYEPFDLQGYIPDFVLLFDHGPVLAEVKPALFLRDLHLAVPKIVRSGWTTEYIVLGADVFSPKAWYGPTLGIIGERDGVEFVPADAAQSFWCTKCDSASFHSESGSFRCRACGADERHRGSAGSLPALWAEAAALVQWNDMGAAP